MASQTSYPERAYPSGEWGRGGQVAPWDRSRGLSAGWTIAGLAGLGLAAWMAWRFYPDLRRYIKMERM